MKILFVMILCAFAVGTLKAQQYEYTKVYAESVRSSERVVKNAAFSGEAVSETVQTLADGNRIVRRTTSKLFRDNEGRYRREDMPKQLGLPGADVDMPQSIFILDPVAGFRYTVNPNDKTVRKMPFNYAVEMKLKTDLDMKLKVEMDKVKVYKTQVAAGQSPPPAEAVALAQAKERPAEPAKVDAEQNDRLAAQKGEIERLTAAAKAASSGEVYASSKYETKNEDLGTQTIEGVQAEGTRSTTTIPAGAIGNERPIEIVYERWFSKDLQMLIVSKHSDPRIGEQNYRVTNIRRDEPGTYLFTPPADYKVLEGPVAPKAVVMLKPFTNLKAPATVVAAPEVKMIAIPTAPKPAGVAKPQDQ